MKELEKFVERVFGDKMVRVEEGKEMNEENVIGWIESLV